MEEGSCSGNNKSSDQKQEKKDEEEDVWSDLHALKRLYDFLQQSVNVVADRVAPQESIEKLDQKSTLLLKRLLDDATQQAVKSKFLFNPSAITNPGVKPTEPPVVVMKPDDQVVAEDLHNPLLPQTTSHIKSNIAGPESGKETPVGWDFIEPLAKKEPSENQISRVQPHQKPNDLSFVKQRDNMLVGRQFPAPSKIVRQRASAMSSDQIFLSGESKPVTPLKLELYQPEKKTRTEKDRDVKNCTKSKLPDSKSSAVVPKLEKDSDGLKRETRESTERKRTGLNRKSTVNIESGTKKRSVNMNLKRRPKDQTSRTIQRSRVDPKQRDRSRTPTVNLKRNPAVERIPRVVKPQTQSSTTSSCSRSRSSCSSSSSPYPSIISTGIRRSNRSSRIHDRSRVVMHPQSKLRSFGSSRRSPACLASLPKQSSKLFLTSREQKNGCRKNAKKEGKLRRIKNKLSVILHHHHHHYHHKDDDNNRSSGSQHRSFWKYIRGKKKDVDRHRPNRKSKEEEIYAEKAVVRDRNQNQHQHGYLHMLLDGLIRHLWHTRSQRKKQIKMNSVGKKLKVKKLHWWQKWKKFGGVKLKGRKKKPLLKLGHGRKTVSLKKR